MDVFIKKRCNNFSETVFDTINQDADKIEQKKRAKGRNKFDMDEKR